MDDKPVIKKLNYTHDAVIDHILANPGCKQGDLALKFGYTQGWLSRVMSSDAFKERFAARREDMVDPVVMQKVETGLEALVGQSTQIIMDKLDATKDAGLAIKALDVATRAMGYGAKAAQVQVNTQFVVQMPAKEESGETWEAKYRPAVVQQDVKAVG